MKLDILVFAAHPDDAEISCAGTILKHIEAGKKVGIVDLTRGELGTRGSAELRAQEAAKASKLMGIHERENLDLGDGTFQNTIENRNRLIQQIRRFKPDIVLCNAVSDRHPDHGRSSKLESDACFYSGLPKIETKYEGQTQDAWRPKAVYHYIQDYLHRPDVVVDITGYFKRKIEVLEAYSSQFFDPDSIEPETPISSKNFWAFLEARARQFGRPIGVDYAEGFTAERYIGIDTFDQLK